MAPLLRQIPSPGPAPAGAPGLVAGPLFLSPGDFPGGSGKRGGAVLPLLFRPQLWGRPVKSRTWVYWILMLSPLPAFLLALQVGAYPISWSELWRALSWNPGSAALPEQGRAVILHVRLPRSGVGPFVGV